MFIKYFEKVKETKYLLISMCLSVPTFETELGHSFLKNKLYLLNGFSCM
jgi:hypothetical protein